MTERNKRLSTATAELYYDDYVQRRNKELEKNRPSSKKSQRSVSSGSGVRPNSKNSRISTGSSRKSSASAEGPKSYEFEAHKYKPNGYKTFNTQLGEDPVTAIRTLKSRLREMSISCATKDRPVKSQICQQACDKLTKAEVEMGNLSHQRSQAILHGKVEDAKKISSQMSELRDRVTYNAYTDLLIDRDQITPFGVQSTWHQTPEHSDAEEEEVVKPRQKAVEPKIREIRSLSARKREREREEGNNKEIKNFRPLSAQKEPKRNVRMFKGAATSSSIPATENDPFRNAFDYGKCNFCNEINGDFSREQFLKQHMTENCPILSRCDYCDQIVEVQKLNEHHLNRCKFVNGDLVPCDLCGLACYKGENSHPRCRKMKPPQDSEWCPLCSIAVKPRNSKEAWDKHLKNDCYNNSRKNLSGVPDPGWDYSLPDKDPPAPEKSKEPAPNANPYPNNYPYPYPNTNPTHQPPAPPPNGQSPPYNNNPTGYPQQYAYVQNSVNPETIKEAFQKIKDDREAELKVMRKKQADREKKEEEAAEEEAKRLEQEVEKLKKKKKAEEAAKKKTKS